MSILSYIRKFGGDSGGAKLLLVIVAIPVLYGVFLWGLSTNPGGFYYDEACQAYNGYLIATTGTALNGASFPLFIQCYTEGLTQWMSPLYVYAMAVMYLFIAPSELSAHVMSASMVFIAALLLGILAGRMSGRYFVGIVVGLTAMATPWLFEVSRLAHEPAPFSARGRSVSVLPIQCPPPRELETIGRHPAWSLARRHYIFIRSRPRPRSRVCFWAVDFCDK